MSPRRPISDLVLRAQTDDRLALLAAEGNGRAFGVLVERHRRTLLAHARRLVGEDRAEDVLQQTLLRAWSALQRGVEVRSAQPWLHRVLHNAALTEIARRTGTTEGRFVDTRDDTEAAPSAAAVAEGHLDARDLLEGIAALPERQRLALLGTALHGRTRRQIASELGVTEGAVRQLVHRARAGVRAAVTAVVPAPITLRVSRSAGWIGASGATGTRGGDAAATIGAWAGGGAVKAAATVLGAGLLGGGVLLAGSHSRPAHGLSHPAGRVQREPAVRAPGSPHASAGGTALVASAPPAEPARTPPRGAGPTAAPSRSVQRVVISASARTVGGVGVQPPGAGERSRSPGAGSGSRPAGGGSGPARKPPPRELSSGSDSSASGSASESATGATSPGDGGGTSGSRDAGSSGGGSGEANATGPGGAGLVPTSTTDAAPSPTGSTATSSSSDGGGDSTTTSTATTATTTSDS